MARVFSKTLSKAVPCLLLLSLNACVVLVPFIETDLSPAKRELSSGAPTPCNVQEFSYSKLSTSKIPTKVASCHSASGERVNCKGSSRSSSKTRVDVLVLQLKHENDAARTNAATDLGQMGPQAHQAVPPLINALKHDKSKWVRRAAAKSLPKISRRSNVVDALEQATRDRNKWVAHSASRALSKMGASRGQLGSKSPGSKTPMYRSYGS
jgi:hypothetical protein